MHAALTVALDHRPVPGEDLLEGLESALGPVLAPFDMELEVPPYRDYEYEDWEEEYRWAVEYFTAHPARRPDPFDPNDRLSLLSALLHTPVHRDPADGRLYAVTTDNPRAQWDYWSIGGRYPGILPVSDPDDPRVLPGRAGPREEHGPWPATGAPVRLLALGEQRARKAARAARDWDRAHRILTEHPFPVRLGELVAEARGEERRRARARYFAQPAVRGLIDAGLAGDLDCSIDVYDRPREEYVADARDGVGLGFAFLDLDGTWYDPDSRAGVRAPITHANWIDRRRAHLDRVVPLLDALPGDAYVVTVDYHS
ncbi:hypothetical protein ABZ249_00900 [Nocardiopsis sp. NPDC006139]|uniref:hypothetical protein n=1 Tax=Nocardiopsis sp. NPDC006139 TaxID=3154578 RepID=UPI0033BD2D13